MAALSAMVIYNAATRELTAKIVYYGPGLGGKTTNLHVLHDRLEPSTVGKLLNLSTQSDRTIYFDLLPVELGDIKGYKIRFQLATVPGQTAFNETRRVVLKGTDGIVFVADSQWTMLPKNLESWQNLKENLKSNGVSFEGIPVVIQYNKRDLTDILSVDAMQEALGLSSYPFVEAVASAGRGVTETFKLISKLTFVDLLRRLQGRRPEEAVPPPPRKVKDELLSFKESLLQRSSPGSSSRPPLSVVPTLPLAPTPPLVPTLPDEAPFETDEAPSADGARAELSDDPFAGLSAEGTAAPAPPAEPVRESLPPGSGHAGNARHEPREFAFEPTSEAPEILSEIESIESLTEPLDTETAVRDSEPLFSPGAGRPVSGGPADAGVAARGFESRFRELQVPAPPAGAAPRESDERLAVMQSRLKALEARLARREESDGGVGTKIRDLEALLEALRPRVDAHEETAGALDRRLEDRERRFGTVEQRAEILEQGLGALEGRLSATEPRVESHGARLESHERRFESDDDRLRRAEQGLESLEGRVGSHSEQLEAHDRRVEAHERWVESADRRQRASEDDIAMALQSVSERGEKLNEQIAGLVSQLESLQTGLEEKTSHGQREAEDIRTQMAPLLEAHGQRDAHEERLLSELDRLRESFADSLAELSERLRRAVRGL